MTARSFRSRKYTTELLKSRVTHFYFQWIRGSGANYSTPQPPCACSKIPGDIGVRITKEGWNRRWSCVPAGSRPPGEGERIPGGFPYVHNCKRIENVIFTWKNHSSFTLENRRPRKPYFWNGNYFLNDLTIFGFTFILYTLHIFKTIGYPFGRHVMYINATLRTI